MSAYVPPVGARVRIRANNGGFLPGTYTVREVERPTHPIFGGVIVVWLHGRNRWLPADRLGPGDVPDRPGDLDRFIARLFPPGWDRDWSWPVRVP